MPQLWNAISLVAFSAAIWTRQTSFAQTPAPGTYRVWLCSQVCAPSDSSRAIAAATVVIFSDQAFAEDSTRSAMARLPAIERLSLSGAIANACFSVTRRARSVGSEELFFGIQRNGTTRVSPSKDGFLMPVYRSPDAGYALRWTEAGPLIRGEGWSYGWAADTRSHRNAYFAARRTGDADIKQCN